MHFYSLQNVKIKLTKDEKKRYIFNVINHFLMSAKLRVLPDDLNT
jgi:hypothetical protein